MVLISSLGFVFFVIKQTFICNLFINFYELKYLKNKQKLVFYYFINRLFCYKYSVFQNKQYILNFKHLLSFLKHFKRATT